MTSFQLIGYIIVIICFIVWCIFSFIGNSNIPSAITGFFSFISTLLAIYNPFTASNSNKQYNDTIESNSKIILIMTAILTGIAAFAFFLFPNVLNPFFNREQSWPIRTVNVIVPYKEGSTMDVCCRALFDEIAEKTGGTFDITNVAGDNGLVAAREFMEKKPDGYTILFNHTAASLVQEAAGKFEYSFTDDFENCATVALDRSLVLCAVAPSNNSKGKSLSDLTGMIEYAKAHPGELRYCTVDGSMTEYVGNRLEKTAGIELKDVDVGSDAERQINALLDGNADLAIFYYNSVKDYIKKGKIICLGVMAKKRVDGIDAPTIKEQGYDIVSEKKLEVKFPKGTDEDIVKYLSKLCKEATKDPEFVNILKKYYIEPYYRNAFTMNTQDSKEVQEYKKYLK